MTTMLRSRERKEAMVGRVRLLSALVGVCLVLIASSYWMVQGIHGAEYREMAENNRLRRVPIKAPRGVLYDRESRPLAENVPSYNVSLDVRAARSLDHSLAFAADILDRSVDDLRRALAEQGDILGIRPARLAENLTLPQVARFQLAALEHPEFEIEVDQLRLYRHREQTAHLLGYLGEINQEELSRSGGEYLRGELLGRRGIESQYEKVVRGDNGERVLVVDSRGRRIEEQRTETARPGRDLQLTIDLDLQQAAFRQLEDKVGAVVALDPRDGEILAMASSPSYDPNIFARRLTGDAWRRLVEDPHHPLQNRAIQNAHSPGSTFKMFTAIAALEEGIASPGTRVFCGGSAVFYGRSFRCWKRAGHGSVDLHQALKQSCDVYFYTIGQRLGIDRIGAYAKKFGFGRLTGVDLAGEKQGLVPSQEWSQSVRKHPWYPGETISVSIGQGPLLVTPLQMAVAIAALANGGRLPPAHVAKPTGGPRAVDPDISADAWERVREGMRAVVMDWGTGNNAKVVEAPQFQIGGKTGTVQVVAQHTWMKPHELPWEKRDHAWFVSFAPVDDPQIVVVVFVEHGGSGSQAAAPIARAMYEEFLRKRPDLRDPGKA
ncbi:MAG TPA: penicillin-binding protein 2 [Thermoanaerobaculia bacterium]|nr:penicillin-binding protein 2 [Thermoanaerobaculia bacterium]